MTRANLSAEPSAVRGTHYIERALAVAIGRGLEQDGCALLVGPYEVGKTALALEVARRFGTSPLVLNVRDVTDQRRLHDHLKRDRGNNGQTIVLDEIHSYPIALDLVRVELEAADQGRPATGPFLILGSGGTETERLVSERLGTRAETFRLAPISYDELPGARPSVMGERATYKSTDVQTTAAILLHGSLIRLETLWMRGGFPKSLVAESDEDSFAWRRRYITKLCGRDYRHISPALSRSTVREILGRIAATQGEPFTLDRSRRDQKACLDYLEDLGLVRQLRPWFTNELKRYEKSPKIYVRDSGLLHSLLNRRNHGELLADAVIQGHSWEGFCIENLITAAPNAQPYFYRSSDQEEIDLALEFPGFRRMAIEIKSLSAKLGPGFERALQALAPAFEPFVVRPIEESYDGKNHRVMTLPDMLDVVRNVPT